MGRGRTIAVAAAASLLLMGLVSCSNDVPAPPPSGSDGTSAVPTSASPSLSPSPSTTSASPTSASPASSPATPSRTSTSGSASPSSAAQTVVHLKVVGSGCDDCAFEAFVTVHGVTTSLGRRSWLTDYPVSWRVPTAATRTLALRFTDLTDADVGGRPAAVVMQYAGVAAGSVLTVAQAQASTSARMCWAGTTRSSATITVRVELPTLEVSPSPTDGSDAVRSARLVYTTPMAGGSGRYRSTVDGGLGVAGPLACP